MKPIKIQIPEGYEIDKESSSSKEVVIKPIKNLDIFSELFEIFYDRAIKNTNFRIIKLYEVNQN